MARGVKRARGLAAGRVSKKRAVMAPAMARRRRVANLRTGGFLGMERKFYDTTKIGSALTTSVDGSGGEHDPATVNCISAPAQGDGEQNRDGNRIVIYSADVTGVIQIDKQANQTATDNAPMVTVALVLDKQTNGAQLNSEDVYTNPANDAIVSATLLRNLQYSSRFQVLKMTEVDFATPSMTFDGSNIEQCGQHRRFRLHWKGMLPVQFKGGATGAGISGVNDNSLHVIAYTSSPDAAPSISYLARIRFRG